MSKSLNIIGRIMVAALFIPAGFQKIMGFAGTVGYIQSAGLPMPTVAAIVAILVEVGVGIAFLVGFKPFWTSIVLAVFTLAAGFGFHQFWSAPADMAQMTQIMFMKNVAIAGGLLAYASLFCPAKTK